MCNNCRLAAWYNNANCSACLVCNHTLLVSHSGHQREVHGQLLVLLFLVVSLTGIFGHLICNIVCIYLYIYVCTRDAADLDTHTVLVSQSERGNLVFLFHGVCLLFAQMRVTYYTSYVGHLWFAATHCYCRLVSESHGAWLGHCTKLLTVNDFVSR